MPHFIPTATNCFFMGVGAALFYGASQLRRVLTRAGQARRAGVTGQTASDAGTLSDLRPRDIRAALQQAPVLQQSRAAKAYAGAQVCWRVSFESAFPAGLRTLRLMCQDQGDWPWVICDVRRGRYPQLSGLLPHAPLTIQGRIHHVTTTDEIYLHKVTLRFPE